MRYVSLGAVMCGFWLVLSGHFTLFLLMAGFGCVVAVLALSARVGFVDVEGHPVELLPGLPSYLSWLLVQLFRSAWVVAKIVLDPSLPISPVIARVRTGQGTPVGENVYANSITFTPGTIAIDLRRGTVLVHALTREMAGDLGGGEMGACIERLQGGRGGG